MQSFKISMFGDVNPYHMEVLDYQLNEQLKGFDKEYHKCGGIVGSPVHQMERAEFAAIAAQGLIDYSRKARNCITGLETKTTYNSESTKRKITITTDSSFGQPKPYFPDFIPN